MEGLDLTLINWLLALAPLVVLLAGLLWLRLAAFQAGLAAWGVAVIAGAVVYGGGPALLFMASLKGLALTLFVVLIIWSSVLLHCIMERLGGVDTLKEHLSGLVHDSLMRCLLMAWCLSVMIMGIAGFGVPVAIIAPLMVGMGYDAVVSASATLVGSAWSCTFGSMGASFYAIHLVTRLEPAVLASWLGVQFVLPTVLSGFAVAHIYGGWPAITRGVAVICVTGLAMGLTQWGSAVAGVPQVASVLAGLSGAMVIAVLTGRRKVARGNGKVGREALLFAAFPYLCLVTLIGLSQVGAIKAVTGPVRLAFDFPEAVTRYGFKVPAETGYASIGVFSHPAPLILFTVAVLRIVLALRGLWPQGTLRAGVARSARQCLPAAAGIATMVMMALVMNDTGMTPMLAKGLAVVGGRVFPLVSPFIGALGCFMTGSNANSNVLFGRLQVEVALALGMNPYIIAALQSVGGALGSSIAPAKVLVGSATVGLDGQEHVLMKRAIPYCLAIVSVTGLVALSILGRF